MLGTVHLLCLLVVAFPFTDDKAEKRTAKEALQSFNDLIGPWRATGQPQTGTPTEKQRGFWKEQIDWSWKFKGEEAWLVFTIKDGKLYKGGTIHYMPDKDKFKLMMEGMDGKE